jgi:hypothetical protein
VQEHPVAIDPARQEHGVLVLGRHDHPEARERPEVLGLGQRHARALAAERGVGDDPAVQLLDEGDPRVLEAPLLLGVRAVVGERGAIVDDPVRGAVGGARAREVREAAAVLDAAQQHRPVTDPGRTRVHDGVDRVGPALRREQRVSGVPGEEGGAVGHRITLS